jgi:polyhydroxyalkanoate synthase subunit PhaC
MVTERTIDKSNRDERIKADVSKEIEGIAFRRRRGFRPLEAARTSRDYARHKMFWRGVNLIERTLLGPLTPHVETPHEIAWMWERSTLLHYRLPSNEVRHRIPILIVPPLMVKPTIFDLRPAHSMVGYFLSRGFDVYMLDFGVPGAEDEQTKVDDYVLDFIPNAVQKIIEKTGAPSVSLIGWSMGGIMSYTYSAYFGKDAHARNLVTIGSPLDFSRMVPFSYLARLADVPGAMLILQRLGNIPPLLTRTGFKLVSPMSTVTRYLDLYINYWDREWVAGYETIGNWVDEFIPYPGAAFRQFVTDFVKDDRLRRGRLKIAGHHVELSRIESNLCVVVGTADKIALPESVAAAVNEIKVSDRTRIDAPLGHIGLVAGSGAPQHVWGPIADWLSPRSDPR